MPKKMNFRQDLIGYSARRKTKKKSVGMIAAPSLGKVNKSPAKHSKKSFSLRGKRVF